MINSTLHQSARTRGNSHKQDKMFKGHKRVYFGSKAKTFDLASASSVTADSRLETQCGRAYDLSRTNRLMLHFDPL
jgi:hypothetical protein